MKVFLSLLVSLLPFLTFSQQNTISGDVIDPEGKPLQFATVALLNPKDSTLAHFGITNSVGKFEISKIPTGNYLMQTAFLGFKTYYKSINIPLSDGEEFGTIVLQQNSLAIGEVQVKGERIPILIKQDTVEYNAGAFKTKPDGVAEDLLKKLPGIEVDRSGNVKAMGEDVKKVLVDGKEFFGNDTKVATKNLPADAINKVQVYNKKTDESELIGLDDKEYDKTINFVLKDDKKKALFGDVKAGGGAEDYYQGNAKVYRFTEKHQFAMLGMLNNVNRPGFSFSDYISFNGGISSMMGGGGGRITLGGDSDIPVDFGQQVNGDVTSGAGGINYSYEVKKNNRLNFSYMGNGTNKDLTQSVYSRNFTNANSFEQNSIENGDGSNRNHMFNLGWRNKSDSIQFYMVNGIVTLSNDNSTSNSTTQNLLDGNLINLLDNFTRSKTNQIKANTDASWMRKIYRNWKMVKISGNFQYGHNIKKSDWNNSMQTIPNPIPATSSQFYNNQTDNIQYSATAKALRRIGKGLYIEPSVNAGSTSELLNRKQGNDLSLLSPIDTLSPKFDRSYQWIKPELTLKYYRKKSKFNFNLKYEAGSRVENLNDTSKITSSITNFLPGASWEYDYRTGQRFSVYLGSSTVMPFASQLIPIISNSNPLSIYYGNRYLKPELNYDLNIGWHLFDNFSFTSLFTNIMASYTKDKISNSYIIGSNLSQKIYLINVPEDYSASGMVDFSTPIKFLGIKIRLSARERWNQGISYVNSISNINTNLTQSYKLSFDNRKKEKWDVEFGAEISFTDAKYSIQKELNRKYYNYAWFGEIRYTPSEHWHFRVTGDVTNYNSQSFGKAVTIPLLGAEINYYFKSNKRVMLTLEGSDLLNKNTGISRSSNLNYLREVHSNTIGRYILLSLKFRLNKFGDNNSGLHIEVNKR
ncbi:MAG: outer membrane beta-barrel protein [Tenuifilaceae bacterium]